jgi:ATP-dependent RNA helicase SUPV3L1/SUV3
MNRATPRLTAVLGPTNTGKTHLAIERMLGHGSGMMGFPLRLLARENYDRVCGMVGRDKAALVTGEEKIVPPGARYFLCTVESMPLDRRVDFLGIDEIQLSADPDRGHIFTDRLLHARGLEETMLLGADTIRPLLRKLAPGAAHIARPRFSTLTHIGPRKLSRLPPRSAVVAFSVADVYEIAELMRRQRGGVAVVMGALSPRTRNAQVQMFQSGAVDFMVATDAIGMGLNMDLDHVAFARLTKFDGHGPRKLTAAEIAQIAGRAGRHMNDGTFGTTEGAPPLDPEIVEAVEAHRFDPLGALFWRNSELDFRSGEALLRSLERRTPHPGLIRVREADDHLALAALWRDGEIRDLAKGRDAVMLLWEVCQVPDFQKILSDAHTRLLNQIYRYLRDTDDRKLPTAWVEEQIERIDRPSGDIDMLMQRLAHIRTWTYVANRGDWLADAGHWQARTRDVEDRLSDALHEALTQRFVDQRHAHLARRMEGGGRLEGAITETNEVMVEGHLVGKLDGFRFQPDADLRTSDARPLMTAARHALETAIPKRVVQVEQDEDKSFALLPNGILEWRGQQIAKLAAGDHPLRPRIEVADGEFLDGPLRERIRRRLLAWFEGQRDQALGALIALENAPLKGAARGLAYQLSEALGALPRNAIRDQLAALSKSDRRALAELGLQIGRVSVWIRTVQNARAARLAQMLLALYRGRAAPPPPSRRPVSFVPHPEDDAAAMHAAGYRLVGPLAVRIDALERLAAGAAKLGEQGPFAATDALAATVGVEAVALAPVLQALGYRRHGSGPDATFERRGHRSHPHRSDATPHARQAPETEAARAMPATDAAATTDVPSVQTEATTQEAKPKRRRRRRRGRKPAADESVVPPDATGIETAPTQPAPLEVQTEAAPGEAAKPKRRRRRRRRRPAEFAASASTDMPGNAATAQTAAPHAASPKDGPKPDDARRDARPRRKHDGKPGHRGEPPRRKPLTPSPDSPFAILATIDWTRRS